VWEADYAPPEKLAVWGAETGVDQKHGQRDSFADSYAYECEVVHILLHSDADGRPKLQCYKYIARRVAFAGMP
jgi:hypothetical protein